MRTSAIARAFKSPVPHSPFKVDSKESTCIRPYMRGLISSDSASPMIKAAFQNGFTVRVDSDEKSDTEPGVAAFPVANMVEQLLRVHFRVTGSHDGTGNDGAVRGLHPDTPESILAELAGRQAGRQD